MVRVSSTGSKYRPFGKDANPLHRRHLCVFLIALVIIVCATDWEFVRKDYFLLDSFEFFFGNRVVGSDWRTIFFDHPKTTVWHDRYRPLEVLTANVFEAAFGVNPRYHLASQSVLKIIGALSLFFCGRKIFKCTIPPMVAALLFVSNPTLLMTFRGLRHNALLLTITILWTWYFYEAYLETRKTKFLPLALAFNLLALMENELAFMLPPFLLLYGFMRNRGLTRKAIKDDIVIPCCPFFILAGVFALFSYLVGGLGAYRPPLAITRLWVNLGYLLFRIPAAFLDLWERGLFISALKPYKIYWIGLWILLLLVSLRTRSRETLRMLGISLVFYICFIAPVLQLLHLKYTPRFAPAVAGLCLCAGSIFIWAESGGRWRKVLAIIILAPIVAEFSASSISYWKRSYEESVRMRRAVCPAIATHVLKTYPSAPPGSVFIIMPPDGDVGFNCCDYLIKALGGRPLSQYLFLVVHPQAFRGVQVMQIPEIFWDDIWCEPVKDYADWPIITWKKRNERSITLREALRSKYIKGVMWISRNGLKWKEVEASPPTLETCREMGWKTYFIKITEDGQITDPGPGAAPMHGVMKETTDHRRAGG